MSKHISAAGADDFRSGSRGDLFRATGGGKTSSSVFRPEESGVVLGLTEEELQEKTLQAIRAGGVSCTGLRSLAVAVGVRIDKHRRSFRVFRDFLEKFRKKTGAEVEASINKVLGNYDAC